MKNYKDMYVVNLPLPLETLVLLTLERGKGLQDILGILHALKPLNSA